MIQSASETNAREIDEYYISDLIDIDFLQILMEKFTNVTKTGTAIVDLGGNILVATGWQEICVCFHRKHPETEIYCKDSDTTLANQLKKGGKYNIYRCKNGLVDVAIPIYIQDRHMANFFIGQFLSKPPDIEFFRLQARKYGFNEEAYLQALLKVPVLTDEEVRLRLDYLSSFAVFLAESGLNTLRLKDLTKHLENRIEERTRDLKAAQQEALDMMKTAQELQDQTQETNNKLTQVMEKLKRSNLELEQFAYVASHDLQEPLRMVSSYVQLLKRRYQDRLDDDANDFIDYAVDGANRMKILINDLLSFSRVETRGNAFEETDMASVAGEAISNLESFINENQALVSCATLPVVMADRTQMVQVFQNLIQNAIKYKSEKIPVVRVSAEKKDNQWIFLIQDNGIGIEEEFFQKIFIIFQRLHGAGRYTGTGIGLAICKRIVERHGGKIWVESDPDKGSTFYFSINAGI